MYTQDQALRLELGAHEAVDSLNTLLAQLIGRCAPALQSDEARRYVVQGVGRRARTIARCIENVFTAFPPDTTRPLRMNAVEDVKIYTQAHMINVAGLLDNWAHVFVREAGANLRPMQVGIFRPESQAYFPQRLRDYIGNDPFNSWHENYAKDYRDALAHRIPLYVPPARVTDADVASWQRIDQDIERALARQDFDLIDALREERENVGVPAFVYVHDPEHQRSMVLHGQLISDALTVIELSTLCIGAIAPDQQA